MYQFDEDTQRINKRHREIISQIVFINYAEFLESYVKDLYENNDDIVNINYAKNEMSKEELSLRIYLAYLCGFHADEEDYNNIETTFKKHVENLLKQQI